MAAHDALGEQFEVVHPNRTMRIGGRNYPAVWTGQGQGHGWGIIPMESGNLAHVEYTSEDFNGYPAGFRTISAHNEHMDVPAHHTADPEEFHRHIEELSKIPVGEAARRENAETIRQHLAWNKQGL